MRTWRRHAPTLAAAALALALAAAASAGARPGAVVLRAGQVGPGYRLQMRSDSHCVLACVSLDVCGFDFRSEALRTSRLQVDYTHPGRTVQVSNEVVTYRRRGVTLAMRELRRAVATCPRHPVMGDVEGIGPVTYRFQRLDDPRLLPGSLALVIRTRGWIYGKNTDETGVAVYQARGNLLSAVYTYGGSSLTRAGHIRIGLHAAEASAENLRRAR